ncbi:MAG: MFS transporter [Actinobacteria bacterium]|nr:MFS transporter [Actinomycetota bacterium]
MRGCSDSPFHIQGLPSLVLGFFGGALADLLDRRRLLQVAAMGQLGLGVLLAGLTAAGRIEVWHIYGVTMLGAGLQSATQPAQSALIPRLVPKHHLMNAIALNSTVM